MNYQIKKYYIKAQTQSGTSKEEQKNAEQNGPVDGQGDNPGLGERWAGYRHSCAELGFRQEASIEWTLIDSNNCCLY